MMTVLAGIVLRLKLAVVVGALMVAAGAVKTTIKKLQQAPAQSPVAGEQAGTVSHQAEPDKPQAVKPEEAPIHDAEEPVSGANEP
jgi:hypothetical protein